MTIRGNIMPTRLEPYFQNGLLYFPQRTIDALVAVGLDWRIGRAAIIGLAPDDRSALDEIHQAVQIALAALEPGTPLHSALTSDTTWFMLTGLPQP